MVFFFLTEPATANRRFRSIYSTLGKAFAAESNKSKDDFAPNKGYGKKHKEILRPNNPVRFPSLNNDSLRSRWRPMCGVYFKQSVRKIIS